MYLANGIRMYIVNGILQMDTEILGNICVVDDLEITSPFISPLE
jgi:hypothetical protein